MAGNLQTYISDADGGIWDFVDSCRAPILQRVAKDGVLAEILYSWMTDTTGQYVEIKASAAPILISVGYQVGSVREWAANWLKTHQRLESLPLIGFDLISGSVRPVAQALYDALRPGEEYLARQQ